MRSLLVLSLLLCLTFGCASEEHVPPSDDVISVTPIILPVPTIDLNAVKTYADNRKAEYEKECFETVYYYCPPFDAIWRNAITFDNCTDPVTKVSETGCIEVLECDPTDDAVEELACVINGMNGFQDKYCNKGFFAYTDCVPCTSEVCDGIDNDCDGKVDEAISPIHCTSECGYGTAMCIDGELGPCDAPIPAEEVCDYYDNDCDGETDEGQLNACGKCGPAPVEVCDGIDNDCDGTTDLDGGGAPLVKSCTTVCDEDVSVCVAGKYLCTAAVPTEEICDGVDNDCDGEIDEDLNCLCTEQMVGALFKCATSPLACGEGFQTCECVNDDCAKIEMSECYAQCYWFPETVGPNEICSKYTGKSVPETCNNWDDNCNKVIDEELTNVCYTGPEGTAFVGLCLPGQVVCSEGVWGALIDNEFFPNVCEDEITPQLEICDGKDNDCDGIADSGEPLKDTDILFIVDASGSMIEEFKATMTALTKFAQTYQDEDALRWAFAMAPLYSEKVSQVTDFVPFGDFFTSFAGVSVNNLGASEPMMDIAYLALNNLSPGPYGFDELSWWGSMWSDPAIEEFKFTWRPNANHVIIVFTDEEPQTFLNPNIEMKDIVHMASVGSKVFTYVFSGYSLDIELFGEDEWSLFAQSGSGGGSLFKISSNGTQMFADLMTILDETACGDE